jgi:hypothetical protein
MPNPLLAGVDISSPAMLSAQQHAKNGVMAAAMARKACGNQVKSIFCDNQLGATWLRRGLQSSVVHVEVQSPRKTAENQ